MVQATVNNQEQPRKLAQLQRKRKKEKREKGEKLESKKRAIKTIKLEKLNIFKNRNFKNGESRYKTNPNERNNKERT